jgi:hypothetical protein
LSGTLTGVISFVREDGVLLIPGQGDPDVVITADRGDHGPIKIPMSQAIDLGILSTVNGRISFSSSDKYVFPGGELVVAPQPSSDERTGRGYKVLLFSGGSGQ